MVLPLHTGLEHPNLVRIVVTGLLAFDAGPGVDLYRSARGRRGSEAPETE